jgi:UDP-2,4-diacetamido-2,4,6-trideoxy-beta-L-altropyranose hydrolase
VVFRVDADARSGIGHFMRCLALAQAHADRGGRAVFVSAGLPGALRDRLTTEGFGWCALTGASPEGPSIVAGSPDDASRTCEVARDTGSEWIVADGYHFDAAYQRSLRDQGCRLLLFDDTGHADYYCADLVLNQNVSADEAFYRHRAPHTRLLLGNAYTALRREFTKWRAWSRAWPAEARRILVTLGGADTANMGPRVLEAIRAVPIGPLEVRVVVGGASQRGAGLDAAVGPPGERGAVSIVESPEDMSELMAWADLAIAAAGSTVWELAFMGLPSVLLVTASNQEASARMLQNLEVAAVLEADDQSQPRMTMAIAELARDAAARQRMSLRGRALVDGAGAGRILDAQAAV